MLARFMFSAVLVPFIASASPYKSEVAAVCASVGDVVDLKFRSQQENLKRIAKHTFGSSKSAALLKNFYIAHPKIEEDILQSTAEEGNRTLIRSSKLKDRALKFSTESQKRADPAGYREAVIETYNELMPPELNSLGWFLSLKDPAISSTSIAPAEKGIVGDFYGAKFQMPPDGEKKLLRILFSNNSSEALPYLLTLIAHELQHAKDYKLRLSLIDDRKKDSEESIVDEARAFDAQMIAYLALAKKDPVTFCNWLYVSWAYGDLMIPLSWTMASMEREMVAGNFIFEYAKSADYANDKFLLNADGSALRPDLQRRINDLKLKFVK